MGSVDKFWLNTVHICMAALKQTVSYLHATQYFEFVYSRDWSKQRDAILEAFATEGSSPAW